jgi:hypothetical protein
MCINLKFSLHLRTDISVLVLNISRQITIITLICGYVSFGVKHQECLSCKLCNDEL